MELWPEIYRRFDPEEPGVIPAWRANRPGSPTASILADLGLEVYTPKVLLTGTIGTGKTTELERIAEARAGQDFVILLDLYRHFHRVVGDVAALQKVTAWEVCFLAGLALVRAARERLGYEAREEMTQGLEEAWRKLAIAAKVDAPAELDFAKLGKAMLVFASNLAAPAVGTLAGATLTALSTATESVKTGWTLPFGRSRAEVPDQSEESKSLLAFVNQLLSEVQLRHRRVLFVIDGLDRVTDIDRAKDLFVNSGLLAAMECSMVVCGSFALRHHPALANVRGFSAKVLVNEPVLDQHAPMLVGGGVKFLAELFERRVADLGVPHEEIIPPELLRQFAYYSGGRSRDFVRMVRMLVLHVLRAKETVVRAEHIEGVIDESRRLMENGMHTGHIEVLESIAADPEHRLQNNPLVWELLSLERLLPYPDGSEWYFPHPLLTIRMVTKWRSGPKTS